MASVPPLPRLMVDGPAREDGVSERHFPLEEEDEDEEEGAEEERGTEHDEEEQDNASEQDGASEQDNASEQPTGELHPGARLVPEGASSLAPSSLAEDEVTVTPSASEHGEPLRRDDRLQPGVLGPSRPDTGGTELPNRDEEGDGAEEGAGDAVGGGDAGSEVASVASDGREAADNNSRPASANSHGNISSAVALDDGDGEDEDDERQVERDAGARSGAEAQSGAGAQPSAGQQPPSTPE